MASKAIGFLNFKFGADLGGFERAMKKAERNLKKFGKNIERTGQTLSTNLTLPILGLGAASVKLASDFQETNTKFNQVFSSIQGQAERTAKVFSESFGLSDLAAKKLLSDTGDLLVGFGFTEQAALDLSDKVNRLAVDLASFTNFSGGSEGASRALTKALVGETESAKALGIVIRQNTKEYKENTKRIMEEQGVSELQAKALNNLEIAYSQTEKAQGDFERTSEGFANQMRILKGEITNAGVSLGTQLLPIAQKGVNVIRGLIDRFNNLDESTENNIVAIGLMVAGIGPLLILIGKLSIGVVALSGAFRTLTAVMTKNPIGFIAVALTTALGAWYSYNEIVKATTRSQNAFNGVAESTDDAVKRITKSVTGMGKDAFQTQIDEINDLINTIKGFEIKESQFTKGVGLSEKQEKQIKDLNMLLFRLKKRQTKAKEETEKLKKSFENLGNETENEKEKITALNIELAHTKQISESLTPSLPTKSFEELSGIVTKLTEEQKIATAGFQMFGDVLTSSLDDALSSQEKFFPIFIANIKKAIQQLLVQLAVMTLISAIMPASLGGLGSSAFSRLNILDNLGSIMGVTPFAQGGLVTGPTTALIGEGIGTTASNPEVVAPLDRLKQFMGGGTQNVVVEGVIKGNDIFLSNRNTGYNRQRSV